MQSVLAIDDSPDIHALLAARLRTEGLALWHATSAADGLAQARARRPDLILLDVEMPDRGGFEVCGILKADPATADIPVVFLTGESDVRAKVRGLDLGAVDYITKPFHAAELLARVRAALRTKRYQDLLATRARIDALTGLWNRAYFDDRLPAELATAQRYSRLLTLIMLDLDHFKRLNDEHGHSFGDRVLQVVGEILQEGTRSGDAACRYGGEEFSIILPSTGSAAAVILAGRLQERLRQSAFAAAPAVRVTASVGVAATDVLPDPPLLTPQRLIDLADEALYVAKREGRDRIVAAPAARARLAG